MDGIVTEIAFTAKEQANRLKQNFPKDDFLLPYVDPAFQMT